MTVGALADAGADRDAIAAAIHSLNAGATVSFETVKRQGIGATKFRVTWRRRKSTAICSHIVKMIEAAEILRARASAMPSRSSSRLGEAEAEDASGSHRESPLPRSRRCRFHRGYRRRLRSIRSRSASTSLLLARQRRQRDGRYRTWRASRSRARHRPAARERARLCARPRHGIDHAHRRCHCRHAREVLRRTAAAKIGAPATARATAIFPGRPMCCASSSAKPTGARKRPPSP